MWSPLGLALCSVLLLLVTGGQTLSADEKLRQLQRDFYDWKLKRNPLIPGSGHDNLLYNFSEEFFYTDYRKARFFYDELKTISRDQLSQGNLRYSHDLLNSTLFNFKIHYNWRHYGAVNPINYVENHIWDVSYVVYLPDYSVPTAVEDCVQRLEAWPTMISQINERMKKAVQLRRTNHNVSMRAVPGQISELINQTSSETDMYTYFNEMLSSSSIPNKQTLRSRVLTALQKTWTKLGDLKAYIEDTYMPRSRTSHGVRFMYGDYYHQCLKWHLSMDMSPWAVYNKSREEVRRIERLMLEIKNRQNFKGSLKAYLNKLMADPRFSLNSNEVIPRYKNIIFTKIFPKLNNYFNYVPTRDLEIRSHSEDMYVPVRQGANATLYVRTVDTKTFTVMPVALRMAVPGHHLRTSRQASLTLPKFQKNADMYNRFAVPYEYGAYSAYTEGWGLYAEYLGEEMGLYQNDIEKMGRYAHQMLLACRAVVDSGLHFQGWTRNQAIKYMSKRTILPRAMVEQDVDRYITFPGQASAGKIGELEIKRLRQKASRELGDSFNIRDFHSAILDCGPVSMAVLKKIVDDYIADNKA